MKLETIGIIGGKGKMGKAFSEYFLRKGFEVYVSDVDTKYSNIDIAQQCDIVIVSVPISKTSEVIQGIAGEMKETSLLMDFTSIKSEPVKIMKRYFSGAVLGVHPMFGPDNLSDGQTIVFCPGRGKLWQKRMKEIFSCFSVVEISAEKHDQSMALVQGLQHFMETVYGSTLANMDIPLSDLLSVSSPIYRLQMNIVGRVLSQDESMYSRIVFGSEYAKKAIHLFIQQAKRLEEGGTSFFEKKFLQGRKYFQCFGVQAKQETNNIINVLSAQYAKTLQHNSKERNQKKDVGTLGPELTWSDLAVTSLFPNKSKRLYPNFSSIFTALSSGEISFALLPIENKISGTVSEVWNEMLCGEYWIEKVFHMHIYHSLAAQQKEDLLHIFGHSAALAQCRKFLQEKYPYAKLVPVASNAEAVSRAKALFGSGAICSPQAAEAANLISFHKNISDKKGNVTRFASVCKRTGREKISGEKLTSFSFELKNFPGALFSALEVFRDAQKNIVRLESRQMGKNFSEYAFFAEIEGDFNLSLQDSFRRTAKNVRILGHYSLQK
jgi:prephenate dehydratase/prephenate dehydrogenase